MAANPRIGRSRLFWWFERRLPVFPPEEPAVPPTKLLPFIFAGASGGRAPIVAMMVLTALLATFEAALFAVVMLLALGNMVASIFRWWGVLVVFLGATIVGAAAYGLLVPGLRTQLIGAYPGIYGLIGAFTFLIWTKLALVGANRLRAFTLIGMLLAVQLVFGLLFGGGWDWVAEVAGFAAGFLLSFVVSPGGFRRVVDIIRQR